MSYVGQCVDVHYLLFELLQVVVVDVLEAWRERAEVLLVRGLEGGRGGEVGDIQFRDQRLCLLRTILPEQCVFGCLFVGIRQAYLSCRSDRCQCAAVEGIHCRDDDREVDVEFGVSVLPRQLDGGLVGFGAGVAEKRLASGHTRGGEMSRVTYGVSS